MNSDALVKRIDSCQKSLATLEKKLDRIRIAEEYNYETHNPYCYDASDKRRTLQEITETLEKLNKYKEQLEVAFEKENSRNVQVILDFVQGWKDKVYAQYDKDIHDAYDMLCEVRKLKVDWSDPNYQEKEKIHQEAMLKYHTCLYGRYEWKNYTNPFNKRQERTRVKVEDGKWEHIMNYYTANNLEEGLKKLDRDLTNEMHRKYDFIIERTNNIVGQIVDATNLHIGMNGELNGYIIGTRGKAKVETIGAGGYNVDTIVNVKHGQCFHFRVLVKEIK